MQNRADTLEASIRGGFNGFAHLATGKKKGASSRTPNPNRET